MSAPRSMLLRQARAAAGPFGGRSGVVMKGQARFASTSSSAQSSARFMPVVVAATLALGTLAYVSKPLDLESAKRKSYAERMVLEKKERQQAEAKKEQNAGGSEEEKEEQDEADGDGASEGSASVATSELEEQATQESAFNPETNEINWDCPCLGGMAHGPCGEQFKEAFSCFVFSEKEPKGIDCVDKFQGMQECFRRYPDHYKEELEDEEDFERAQDGEEPAQSPAKGDDAEDEDLREFQRELSKEGGQ